ncbi:MAG: phage portal protein [archaeon]
MADENDAVVTPITTMNLTGRKQIFTSLEVNEDNLSEILNDAFMVHMTNAIEIDYLFNYYKGNQPILLKTKPFRPEINNRVLKNYAFQIVDFHTGNTFSQPIQYVQAVDTPKDDAGSRAEPSHITKLNRLMRQTFKSTKDRELGEHMFICGTGYRITLPSKDDVAPFLTDILNPRRTFVVYSNDIGREPVLGVHYNKQHDYQHETTQFKITAYSKNKIWKIERSGQRIKVTGVKPNPLGVVPIVEYPLNPNRLGQFEPVISLLDSINNIESNRADAIQQVVQAILKFKNCEIDEDVVKKIQEWGALQVDSDDGSADAEYISADLDQSQAQELIDDLYQSVLTIANVPDRNFSSGGNTGQALVIGQGWQSANNTAESVELMFKQSEYNFLKAVFKILEINDMEEYEDLKNVNLREIGIKFTRSKTYNLLTKTQGLQNLLEAGIHPRIAMEKVDLFTDAEEDYQASKPYLKKWEASIEDTPEEPANNKPDPNEPINI